MECTKYKENELQVASPVGEDERLVSHYKPNIWSYESLESLASDSKVSSESSEKMKEELVSMFNEAKDASKLKVIDDMCKLGLSDLFHKEITHALNAMASCYKRNPIFKENIGTASLCFRLLRQHGYNITQELVGDFLDEEGAFESETSPSIKECLELFEASHLAFEEETSLTKARDYSREYLKGSLDQKFTRQVVDALGLPLHWRAQWFGVREQIDAFELEAESDSLLLKLAKLNFNIVQAIHQNDLKYLSMWWRELGLINKASFARDRLVESFAYAVGIVPEPQYSFARICIAKVISFILVIDDVYDLFGSIDELECFTRAVESWSIEETRELPECMRICFSALYETMTGIAGEIQEKNNIPGALSCLANGWAGFCKSMLREARWQANGYTPTLEEYMNNAWISSSGPLLSRAIYLSVEKNTIDNKSNTGFQELQDLTYYISMIIRLCNDEATNAAELERGDSPSSIMCYMTEANATEEVARRKIRDMVVTTWNKINAELLNMSPMQLSNALLIVNSGRVAHCFYNAGDGFGEQDGQIKIQIKRMLVEPLSSR